MPDNDNVILTFATDLGDIQTKPNNTYLPLQIILFLKYQTNDKIWWPLQLFLVNSKIDLHYIWSLCIPNRWKILLFAFPMLNMHYLVWFGGHTNQLQWSPLQCPWCGIFKKVYYAGVNMHYLVWFSLEVTQISCRGHHCIVLGVGFSKRYIM